MAKGVPESWAQEAGRLFGASAGSGAVQLATQCDEVLLVEALDHERHQRGEDPTDAPNVGMRVERDASAVFRGFDEVATRRANHARPLPLKCDFAPCVDANQPNGRVD